MSIYRKNGWTVEITKHNDGYVDAWLQHDASNDAASVACAVDTGAVTSNDDEERERAVPQAILDWAFDLEANA